MSYNHQHHKTCNRRVVSHKIVCQHQVEVEVWPAQAEVYFYDEAHIDPVNTQIRFDAVVNNAPSSNVHWEVTDIAGNQGAGEIDQAGLYIAPKKGSNPHGLTDIVVATSVDDPMRKAFAMVSLIGFGPQITPEPKIEIYPKQINLYYRSGYDNKYIDRSNTMQLFSVLLRNSPTDEVNWKVGSQTSTGKVYLYKVKATQSGAGGETVWINATIPGTTISDKAKVVLLNYDWPGIA